MTTRRYLEIGPGDYPLGPEWETIDCRDDVRGEEGKTWIIDHPATQWGSEPLPFNVEDFDLVYASHVLEHVPWFQTVDALKEVYRILKPGGVFEVWVPDFQYLVNCYNDGRCGDDWRKHNPNNDHMLWLNGRVFTYGGPGGLADPNWHRALFDEWHLMVCLEEAGFDHEKIKRIDKTEKPRGHDHGPINLGMRATK